MPLFDYQCPNGHREDSRYVVRFSEADNQRCRTCNVFTQHQFAPGAGRMLFFEEGRARRIRSLDGGKTEITTYAQHERVQRECGVTYATKDDMLHGLARDSMDKPTKNKREPGWMREYVPAKWR